ncbi:hypothetical protein IW262DRAFT_295772 [Armillaria fumosa]|nr:hypothetical protein IW262DRAFT_295772 [Armillaria fumosa]
MLFVASVLLPQTFLLRRFCEHTRKKHCRGLGDPINEPFGSRFHKISEEKKRSTDSHFPSAISGYSCRHLLRNPASMLRPSERLAKL